MKPSRGTYPYQYFWDTCFHAFILSALNKPAEAKQCLRSLFAMQTKDGFVGHMLFWKKLLPDRINDIFQTRFALKNFFRPYMSSLIQPPLAAQAVLRVYKADGDIAFVREMLPKLKKQYKWLVKNRDLDGSRLLSIISYFESGMDWKPAYDEVLGMKPGKANAITFVKVVWVDIRNFFNGYDPEKIAQKDYFVVRDAGLNTIYSRNLFALADMCQLLDDEEADYFAQKAKAVEECILRLMYDKADGAFYDVYGKENRKLKTPKPTIFFPMTIRNMADQVGDDLIRKHLLNKDEFWTTFPIPSVAINHPAFNPHESIYIWRGPTWVIYNWFLHQFLLETGFREEARFMVESVKNLIIKSGFREYYNPFTGEGYGAHDFTWSGLIVDMMDKDETVKQGGQPSDFTTS